MLGRDVMESVARRLVESLESGQVSGSWVRPWRGGGVPSNVVTGAGYRGGNVLALWFAEADRGFSGGGWATYKQWESVGAQVRKGEKGTHLVKWSERRCKDHAPDESCLKCGRMVPSGFVVFHADQVDGWEAPPVEVLPVIERDAVADAAIVATGAAISYGGDRACYSPAADMVRIPSVESFLSRDGFYGTVFHELGHWTGHGSRLGRDLSGRFGDDAYAAEELVAEITAAMLCAVFGVVPVDEVRPDHVQYLASWARVLKADPQALWTAATKAQAAADYVVKCADRVAVAA